MATELDLLIENAEDLFNSDGTEDFETIHTGQELVEKSKLLKEALESCINWIQINGERLGNPEEIQEVLKKAKEVLS